MADLTPPTLPQRAAAELIGTSALVFAGCGAIITDAKFGLGLGNFGIALVFGLVVLTMVVAVGPVSGAHLNPAVTLALVANKHFAARELPAYLAAQLVGATLAAALLAALWSPTPTVLGATLPAAGIGLDTVFAYELALTALLVFVILCVVAHARPGAAITPIAIGAAVAIGAIVGGPVSGGSMNPARSFGPALLAGEWQSFYIYLLAPLSGALAACALARLTLRAPAPTTRPTDN